MLKEYGLQVERSREKPDAASGVGGTSATSGPKRFEWVRMNLDTGAAVNTFPLNFGPEGAGDGQENDENGLLRFLNGTLTGVTKFCAVLQRSRAKDDKIFTLDTTVDT